MMRSRTRREGHTLLEMILASFLMATVAVGILSVWTMQDRAIKKTGHVLVAQYLGERLIEECIAAGYEGVLTMAHTIDSAPTGLQAIPMELKESVKDPGKSNVLKTMVYRGTIDVTNISFQAGVDDTRMVVVTIDWDGNIGRSSLDYRTYIQEKG